MKFYVPDPATLKEDYSRLVMVEVRWCVRERARVCVVCAEEGRNPIRMPHEAVYHYWCPSLVTVHTLLLICPPYKSISIITSFLYSCYAQLVLCIITAQNNYSVCNSKKKEIDNSVYLQAAI